MCGLDANTRALNNYLWRQDQADRIQENFEKSIDDLVAEMLVIQDQIMNIAQSYEDFDFTDNAKVIISDALGYYTKASK